MRFGDVRTVDMCLMLNTGFSADPLLVSVVSRFLACLPSIVVFLFFSKVLPTKVRLIKPPRLLSSGRSFVVAIC